MVDVTIQGERTLFDVAGMHKLWSFRRQIAVPLIIEVSDVAGTVARLRAALGGP
jgi:hypothetical protein